MVNLLKRGKTPNSERPTGARNKFLRMNNERKHKEAAVRNAAYAKMTPEQKTARDRAWDVQHNNTHTHTHTQRERERGVSKK